MQRFLFTQSNTQQLLLFFPLPVSLALQCLVGIKVCQGLSPNTTFKSPRQTGRPPPGPRCSLCAWHTLKGLADPSSLRPTYQYLVLRHGTGANMANHNTPLTVTCPRMSRCRGSSRLGLSCSPEPEPEVHRLKDKRPVSCLSCAGCPGPGDSDTASAPRGPHASQNLKERLTVF